MLKEDDMCFEEKILEDYNVVKKEIYSKSSTLFQILL